MSHMNVIDSVCNEVAHGFGKRLMAIPSELMKSAPESLLKITKEMSGRDIANSAEIGYVELTKQQKILETKTYRVFAFRDSEEKMNHESALAFAERTGMRLLDKDEAEWFHKNFDKLPMWKKSLGKNTWYWTSSVYSNNRSFAWQFVSVKGIVNIDSRNYNFGVRCIGNG